MIGFANSLQHYLPIVTGRITLNGNIITVGVRIRLVIFCCFVLFFGGHRPFSFLHTTHSLVRPDRARPNANAKKEKGRGTTKKNEQFGKKKTKEKKRGSGKSTSPQSGCGAAVTQIVFLLLFRHHRHSLVKKKKDEKKEEKNLVTTR